MNNQLVILQNLVKSLLDMNDDWDVERIDYQAIKDENGELLYWQAYIYTDSGVTQCLSDGRFF